MAELIPGADLFLMGGVGHFAMWEKTEQFNRVILDYLSH
jgi:pimeloyl-ACP methyl ester carboxylesterase